MCASSRRRSARYRARTKRAGAARAARSSCAAIPQTWLKAKARFRERGSADNAASWRNRDSAAYGHPIRSMRKAASNVELRRGVGIGENAGSVRRCDTWGLLADGEPKMQRAKPAGAAPGRMSGGELTTVVTIDGPLRGDCLFSLGSAGDDDDEKGFALVVARSMTCSGAYARDRRASVSPRSNMRLSPTSMHTSATYKMEID